MGWLVSMHGSTDHLDPEVADEAETTLRDRLAAVFGELVAAGHQGVAGVFHHSHGSPVDLRSAGAPAADPTTPAPEVGSSTSESGAVSSGDQSAAEAPSEPEAAPEPSEPVPAATAPENAATEASAPEG